MEISAEISPDQEKVVEELKRRLINEVTPKMLEDESLFYRFSKARDFKLPEAEAMLRKHISWRKEVNIDAILTKYQPLEVAEKYIPFSFVCFDKDGCLVRYIDLGSGDIKGVFSSLKKIDILKYAFVTLEKDELRLREHSKKTGKPETKSIFVFNFKEFSFLKATHKEFIECFIQFALIFQDNYPERIKKVIFLNVSTYFTLAFSVIKTVLAAALLQKMKFFGSEGYQEELLESISADDLPAFLGGNKTDPDGDPLCKSFIIHGSKVPKKHYLCNSEKILSKAPDAEKLIVMRFSKEEKYFEVKEPGSFLEWEFETKNKDIEFVIYFKENFSEKSNLVELIPKQRIDTCYKPEKGLFRCDKPGTYVVVFDNSYSWLHPKEIYYRARVRLPNA
ncbi:SEC14-like protein 4 [Trichonephila clavata]|uniref:SEC14-like protein 4 n=1 Tax=Trichonephila clavata TaxID=2740835 RepID=A0A8X6FLT6_TRICU|nr:SEC14-like protein 4 [Trichonephila clavata]